MRKRRLQYLTITTAVAGCLALTGYAAANALPGDVKIDEQPTQGGPLGFGAGTTGGEGGETVTVSSAEDFEAAATQDGPLVIEVDGMIGLESMTDVSSDKTVVGVGDSSGFEGSGLNISDSSNVIVQNLNFSGSNDDGINVEYAQQVWLDHNTFTDSSDGALDIKRASDNVTVSWNHFRGTDKTALLGHDDDNGDEDSGALHVTYDHNWFDGSNQRNPRVRFGNPVHVVNNYYSDIGSYGVASTMEAGVLVEANFFEGTEDPFHLGEGDSPEGSLEAVDNHFVDSGEGRTGGSVEAIPYDYQPESARSVKDSVTAGAGSGNL